MIWTHLWNCGRWTWRLLTFKQWAAMPAVGKKLALIKTGKVGAALVCAGGIGVAVPELAPDVGAITPAPIVSVSPGMVDVPEPGSLLVLGVALSFLAMVRASNHFTDLGATMGGFLDDDYCAGCGSYIADAYETGVSGIYFPGDSSILLCMSCYTAEEATIERAGTNDHPELLARYHRMLASVA